MTIRIEKIQLRRGLAADLPADLDEGELGYMTDLQRLFVGIGSNAMATASRNTLPYHNIEVLTENSPLELILGRLTCDNRSGFLTSLPLAQTTLFTTVQMPGSDGIGRNLLLDFPSFSGANARIQYFIYDAADNPIRLGTLWVLWNRQSAQALCRDKAQVLTNRANTIQFQAVPQQVGINTHVLLQYSNQTAGTPTMYFRIDRPVPNPIHGEFSSDFSGDFLI